MINLITDPSYIWAIWPAMGWGIGIARHALRVYQAENLFSSDWEKKQIEKRLAKKQ